MRYRSTRDAQRLVSLATAVLKGLPPDRGLYVPERVPRLHELRGRSFSSRSFVSVALEAALPFFEADLDSDALEAIVEDTLAFDAPVVPVAPGISVLELFHGPTLAFKDFGARFMARVMARLREGVDDELTVLVATSGDTGAAVASGFFGVEGVRVFLLFPRGRVSDVQERQLTTFGGNIRALEVDGTFDDCQALVKEAFVDDDLTDRLTLTSANSINIARLIPQTFYYLRAAQQVGDATFCVPSGNLGNLTAGLLIREMGLPTTGFLSATNVNDGFVRYLRGEPVRAEGALRTLSNAMDVAVPSNLERIEWLFAGDRGALRSVVEGGAVDDRTTLETMARVHAEHGYLLDPHTATGWTVAERWRASHPGRPVVVLATAHPAKFPEAVQSALGCPVEPPEALRELTRREPAVTSIPADYEGLRALLAPSDASRPG